MIKTSVKGQYLRKSFLMLHSHLLVSCPEKLQKRSNNRHRESILPGERDHVLEIISKLVYSKSESKYDKHYQALLKSGLKTVISYYNTNWHGIAISGFHVNRKSVSPLEKEPTIDWKTSIGK